MAASTCIYLAYLALATMGGTQEQGQSLQLARGPSPFYTMAYSNSICLQNCCFSTHVPSKSNENGKCQSIACQRVAVAMLTLLATRDYFRQYAARTLYFHAPPCPLTFKTGGACAPVGYMDPTPMPALRIGCYYIIGDKRYYIIGFGHLLHYRRLRLLHYPLGFYYRAMHFSAKRGIAIACRLSVCPSVCNVGGL